MTSKERIYKILNFKTPDRIGIHDTFLDTTLEMWKREGLPADASVQDYFGLDIEILDLMTDDRWWGQVPFLHRSFFVEEGTCPHKKKKRTVPVDDKFIVISFTEPFQRLCDIFGREDVLRGLAYHPERIKRDLASEAERIIDSFQRLILKGVPFDGAWAWGDLAYAKGLFFSHSCYRDILLPVHKDIFHFLNSRNILTLFHSDGMILDIIPHLLDAGVRAFHPLDENSGMDLDRLLRDYKDDMVFMGCMDIEKFVKDKDPLKRKINSLKENCFYIYEANYPIMPNISFKDYNLILETVKEAGAY